MNKKTKGKGSADSQLKDMGSIKKLVSCFKKWIGISKASGSIKDWIIVVFVLAIFICIFFLYWNSLPYCIRMYGWRAVFHASSVQLCNGMPSWGEHVISFVTFANSVVSAALTTYVSASTASTHGFFHTELLGFKKKRVYSHILVYVMARLTLICDVFALPVCLFACALCSMLLTGWMVLRASRLSSLNDHNLLSLLRERLCSNPMYWRQLIHAALDRIVELNNFSNEGLFFQRCFLDSWQTVCKKMTPEQVCSSDLFEIDCKEQTMLFENICYLQQSILHKLNSRPKALFSYITQTLTQLETIRCEVASESKNTLYDVDTACVDLYTYMTYLNLIFFLKDSPLHKKASLLLETIVTQMPLPLQSQEEIRALFERTRVLAVWYCINHHTHCDISSLCNLGIEYDFLPYLILIDPQPRCAAVNEKLISSFPGSTIVLADNSVLSWYRQCRIAIECINSMLHKIA